MLENKLWLVEFQSNQGDSGAGIVSFKNGHVFGGDSTYYYYGKYIQTDYNVEAIITITRHSKGSSIFGDVPTFNLQLKGSVQSQPLKFNGQVKENPQMKINGEFKKLEDLP